MQKTFTQQFGGNKQTDEMVEFSRGILHLQGHQNVKANLIEAAVKYVVSDPAIINFKKVFEPTGLERRFSSYDENLTSNWTVAGNERNRQKLEFWKGLENKDNKYGLPGLYYAIMSVPQFANSTVANTLRPLVKDFDDVMQKETQIGDNVALKMMQTYKVLLVDGDNLSQKESDIAFDHLLTDAILATKEVQPRDENVYGFGMKAISEAGKADCKKSNGLDAAKLFSDNQRVAFLQGFDDITKKYPEIMLQLVVLGHLQKSVASNRKHTNS